MTLKLFNYRYGLPPKIIAEGFKRFISLTHFKMKEPSFKILVMFCLPYILVVIFSKLFHHMNSINHMDASIKGYARNENSIVTVSLVFDRLFKPFKTVSPEESIHTNEQIQKHRNVELFEMNIARLLKVKPSESKMIYEKDVVSSSGHADEQPELEIVGKKWEKSVKEIGLVIVLMIYFVRALSAYCLLDSRKSKIYLTKDLNLLLSNGLNISPIRDTLERCKIFFADFMKSCDSYYRLNNLAKFNTSCVMTIQQINNERLASFRPFPPSNIPSCLSFIKLAEAGFVYSGNGSNIKCVGCGREEQVDKFEHGGKMLDPEASMFHNTECKFIKPELHNRQYITLPVVFPETGVQDSSLAIINGFQCAEIATQDQEELSDQRSPEISPCESEPRESNLLIQPQEHLEPLTNAFAEEFHQEEPSPLDVDSLGAAAASMDYQSGASAIDDSTWNEDNLWESNFNPEHASYGNDDLTTSLPMHQVPCDKNPGHYAYFPLRQLNLQQIPSAMRTGDGIKFLKLLGDLTVRVKVSFNKKLNKSDDSNCIFGTGYVSLAEQTAKVSGELGSHGKLDNLKKKMTSFLNKTKEYIIIETNKHILCNAEDAQITVEFFYDHPSRRDVKVVKAVSVTHSKTSGDNRSILTCTTSDQSFVKKINQTRLDVLELANKLPKRAKELMMKKLFIISHPHGNEKILSYGDSVLVKYAITQAEKDGCIEKRLVKINNHQQVTRSPEQMKKVLLYAADTCFGSSGAPVVTFKRGAPDANGQPTYHMDLWMHNGVEKNIKLGASNLRECSLEDIQPYQTPNSDQNNTPNADEESEDDEGSPGNQIVSSPVFKVMSHPSYPVYIAYQKRLESLAAWQYPHIHTREQLAYAGFFYAGYSDCVRCFQCGLGLRSWKPGDNVIEEHKKHRETCPFLQAQLRSDANNLESSEIIELPQLPELGNDTPKENDMDHVHTTEMSNLPVKEPNVTMTEEATLPAYLFNHFELPQQVATVNCVIGCKSSPSVKESCDQVKALKRENIILKQQLMCKVCCKSPIKDLFLPCGELYACSECSKLLTHCPSCNTQILATVTTYFG